MKKKILIIEDEELDFNFIKNTLESNFSDLIEIFPKDNVESNELIDLVMESKIESIMEKYRHIDMFILDVSLVTKSKYNAENDGLTILKTIKKKIRNPKFIVVSNSSNALEELENEDEPFFIDKNLSELFQKNEISRITRELLKLESKTQLEGDNTNKEKELTPTQKNLIWLEKKYISSNKLLDRVFNWLISTVLLGLVLITLIYGVKVILKKFSKAKLDSKSILDFSEYVFISFLPLFIALGFYSYYRYNGKMRVLKGKTTKEDAQSSYKALNLTKVLFISSIISFLTLKIITKISDIKEAASVTEIFNQSDTFKIALYSILLIILIVYLLLIKKLDH